MYGETGEESYLTRAKGIYDLYTVGGGMDLTYQNLNWWGRPNPWTEPCAIVDSVMVALTLYEITKEESYRQMATRIYHNGLATAQRGNGGAGTDSVVYLPYDGFEGVTDQYMTGYEAPFCCTMRLCEGLWYISTHTDMLWYETDEDADGKLIPTKDACGRYMSGDILLAEPAIDPAVAAESGWKLPETATVADGHKLLPLIKYYKTPDAVAVALRQKVVF
jgi:hypothetical protein